MMQRSEEFLIERLGAQGDGVTADGVYVAHTLPGERVQAARLGDRARLERVLEPSPDRVTPACGIAGTCGGCAVMHASDAYVVEWKTDLVTAALAARGIEGVRLRPLVTVPPRSRRRIAVSARRTRSGMVAGFHAQASAEIVPLESCDVADPRLVAALGRLAEIVSAGASRKGEIRLTLTASEGGVDVAVTEAKELNAPGLAMLAGRAVRAEIARLSWNGEIAVTIAPPVQRMGRARVVPPPGGFLQPTVEGEAALVAAVAEAVDGAERLADLFAGSGTFALPLAERAEVLAVEGEQAAVEALEAGWRGAPGLRRVRTEVRDLFARPLRAGEMAGLGAVVFDPPRAGARAQAEQIAASGVARVAAVSCNPATFARDARILIDAGYALDWVQPVDQFRWSPHVELVGALRKT